MGFTGWPTAAFEFLAELEANNNRAWWLEHRPTYDNAILAPFEALASAVNDEFGPLHRFRPNRDVRFSKDKSPYKTVTGAMTESQGGSSYYVQLSSDGLFVGSGMYHLASDQLARFREALLDDALGSRIAAVTDALAAGGYDVTAAETLKTAPRGWDREHPRIELARRKGLVIARTFGRAKWQSTAKSLGYIESVWRDAAPMNNWLDEFVGPSTLPPPDFG